MKTITGEISIFVEVTEDDLREVFDYSHRKDDGLKFDSLTGWVDGAIDGNYALQDYVSERGADYGEVDIPDFCEWIIEQCPQMPEENDDGED